MRAETIVDQLRELHVLGADGPMKEAANLIERLLADCETWEATAERLGLRADAAERKADEERQISRVVYDQLDAWHEMAEDLWGKLQKFHEPTCPQVYSIATDPAPCNCRRVVEAKWDEITGAGGICSCGGDGWVEDKNWDPDPALRLDRVPWNGLIPCGFCNEAGDRPHSSEAM